MNQYIRCVASGGMEFGLPLQAVRRIHGPMALRREAEPGALLGWAGETPVYAAGPLFGLPVSAAPPGAILFLSRGELEIGLAVERIIGGAASKESGELRAVPEVLGVSAFRYVAVSRDGTMLPVCDWESLPLDAAVGQPPAAAVPATRQGRSAPGRSGAGGAGRLIVSSVFDLLAGPSIRLALSFTQVLEVLASPPVLSLPGCVAGFAGLVHWRNRLVPMVDPASCFGLPLVSAQLHGRVLVVRDATGNAVLALPAGADTSTMGMEAAGNRSADLFPARQVRFAFRSAAGVVLVPDVDAILAGAGM